MGLTAFNRMRREAAAQEVKENTQQNGTPGPATTKTASQVKLMNKTQLLEYGASLGLTFLESATNKQMVEAILERMEQKE